MFVSRSISADHKDLIHDVAYDFYGKRMATCSSDQSVKVWELGDDGQWTCTSNWKTHSGSVWKVTWAHPEFGQVLATCSFDRTAAVWEELGEGGNERLQTHWVKRTSLVDSRTSVTDVRFAPRHMGLQLATCSSEGIVRIYEALDVMNLSSWTLQHEISCKLSCSCVAWGPTRKHAPVIAVGSDDSTCNTTVGGKVFIYQFFESQRKWLRVETIATIMEPVHDIAFAPSLGRSYYLLAVASKDVTIISLKAVESIQKSPSQSQQSEQLNTQFEIREVGHFDDHTATIWRVSWNITGTILASTGDDGYVRLWKANYMDKWKCIANIRGENGLMHTEALQSTSK